MVAPKCSGYFVGFQHCILRRISLRMRSECAGGRGWPVNYAPDQSTFRCSLARQPDYAEREIEVKVDG